MGEAAAQYLRVARLPLGVSLQRKPLPRVCPRSPRFQCRRLQKHLRDRHPSLPCLMWTTAQPVLRRLANPRRKMTPDPQGEEEAAIDLLHRCRNGSVLTFSLPPSGIAIVPIKPLAPALMCMKPLQARMPL